MKSKLLIVSCAVSLFMLVGCNKTEHETNAMAGKVFRYAADLPEFKDYEEIGGSVIESSKDENGDYRLSLGHLKKDDHHILILEEISKPAEDGKVDYTTLDTINVEHVKENQHLTYGNCSENNVLNEVLIALAATGDDPNVYTEIIKVWSADTHARTFNSIVDIKGISCVPNEVYDEEEEYSGEDSMPADTLTLPIDTLNQTDSVYHED